MSQEQHQQTVQQWRREYDRAGGFPLRQDEDKHMKIGDMIESKYLKQSDIDGEVMVTVKSLKKVNVARDDADPEYRWTVYFSEFSKPLVLNVTNLKRMAKYLGDDTDDWINQCVMLYVDENIEYAGQIVGGIRIKGVPRKATATPRRSLEDVNSDLAVEPDPFA